VILHFMKGGMLKRKPNGGLEELDSRGRARAARTQARLASSSPPAACSSSSATKNKVGRGAGAQVLLHHDKRTGDFDLLHEYEKFAKYFRVRRDQRHLVDAAGRDQDPASCGRRSSRTLICGLRSRPWF
jgi:hypothetical protein